jgi:hypothetical protein
MTTSANLIFPAALAIGNNAIAYTFIQRLQNASCKCSNDWRREAILLMTVFNFFLIFVSIISVKKSQPLSFIWLKMAYASMYFVIVLSYTHKLKASYCKCAEGLDSDIVYLQRAIPVVIVFLLISAGFLSYMLGIKK